MIQETGRGRCPALSFNIGVNIMDQLHPDDYDDHMKSVVRYGEDLDIVRAAIQTLLDKYPTILQATLLLEHKSEAESLEDSHVSGNMMAGDALGPAGEQDRVRAIRSCARFIEDSTLRLMVERGDFHKDEDEGGE